MLSRKVKVLKVIRIENPNRYQIIPIYHLPDIGNFNEKESRKMSDGYLQFLNALEKNEKNNLGYKCRNLIESYLAFDKAQRSGYPDELIDYAMLNADIIPGLNFESHLPRLISWANFPVYRNVVENLAPLLVEQDYLDRTGLSCREIEHAARLTIFALMKEHDVPMTSAESLVNDILNICLDLNIVVNFTYTKSKYYPNIIAIGKVAGDIFVRVLRKRKTSIERSHTLVRILIYILSICKNMNTSTAKNPEVIKKLILKGIKSILTK